MDALPELDIQEDLEELDDEVVEGTSKEPSVAEPEDIFAGKPTNGKQAPPKPKKRPVSEKQRAHLDRIRVKALESVSQSVSQGFICEIINKRANTCDPTIEEYVYSSRSSMIWCLGLVWSACAYRVPCLPKLVLF